MSIVASWDNIIVKRVLSVRGVGGGGGGGGYCSQSYHCSSTVRLLINSKI